MGYNLISSSADCYEGTSCLVNKFGIQDADRLSQIEAQITFAKAALLDAKPIDGSFDFQHFKKMHEFLFSDLYAWAGEVRTIDISKKRTCFMHANQIESFAPICFSKIANGFLNNLPRETFALRIAELYNEINYIHPFREGNGRTQRIFFTQLIRSYGYDINFSETDTDELMIATVQASAGVLDYLKDYFLTYITEK